MFKTLILVTLLGCVVQAAVYKKTQVTTYCRDFEGNVRANGDEWSTKCDNCKCTDGITSCGSAQACPVKPEGVECTVRPGTENDCCKQYDCKEEENRPCQFNGIEKAHGETWKDGVANCECKNGTWSCSGYPAPVD